MYHLDNTSGVPEMPALKDVQSISSLWFGESEAEGGISWPGADWFNIVQAELLSVLLEAGIDKNKHSLNQLAQAIKKLGGTELRKELFLSYQYIAWTTPQVYGACGDGESDDTDALYNAFKSSAETVHIPRGTYLITRKLKCLLTKNLNVVCAPGVVFKLADGVRDKMFVFVGADNRKYDFSWFGG
ncbi:glycosyl hydrolase family 28-related protein, partial [Klebsiella pneumoniae]